MYSVGKAISCTVVSVTSLLAWVGTTRTVFADGATRDLPEHYTPGVTFAVSILVEPTPGTLAWVAEDSPPEGWTEIDTVNDAGTYDSQNHKVKWGLFFDDQPRTLTYEITPPGDATGEHCFDGNVFFDGYGHPIGGDRCVLPEGVCPAEVTISAASPPDGTVDARQPHEPAADLPRQGVGSSTELIAIVLDPPVSGAEGCFELCETMPDPLLGANSIATVTHTGDGTYEIVLDHVITAGAVTTIEYTGDGSYVAYVAHSANVNADGVSNADDVLALIDILDGAASPPWEAHSTDANHGGMATAADVLRVIDLLNGAAQYDSWLGTQLPGNTSCP